jgi:hypothetical protein
MSSDAVEDLDGSKEGQQYPASDAAVIESPMKNFEPVAVHVPDAGNAKVLTRPPSHGNTEQPAVVPMFAPANWPKAQDLRGIRSTVLAAAAPQAATTARQSSPKIVKSARCVHSASAQQR